MSVSRSGRVGERIRGFGRKSKAFLKGTFVDGPRHTWHAVKTQPVALAAMTGGIGGGSTLATLAGINPHPTVVGISVCAVAFDMWVHRHKLRSGTGEERAANWGESCGWPVMLSAATFGLGGAIGSHGGHVDWSHGTAAAAGQIAKDAGVSVILASDAPLIANTALDDVRQRRRNLKTGEVDEVIVGLDGPVHSTEWEPSDWVAIDEKGDERKGSESGPA